MLLLVLVVNNTTILLMALLDLIYRKNRWSSYTATLLSLLLAIDNRPTRLVVMTWHCWGDLRLINLKGTFSVLAGSCWRTENRLHFFLNPFSIQPIIFFVFVFSFSLFQPIGLKNTVEGSWGSIWSIHHQKTILRYVNTITNNLLWWSHVTYNATINIL